MRVKIVTKDHEYQGLYCDTMIENAQYLTDDTMVFDHNGKDWTIARDDVVFVGGAAAVEATEQYTGSSSDYYKVYVKNPTTLDSPYEAECNDVIEALNMTFAEGNAFKAIWRKAKARQGVKKKGYDNGLYDSEKVVFFGQRMLVQAKEEYE